MHSSRNKKSAGLLPYRISNNTIQVFLVHPGGPFWRNKDEGAWSIPKGEHEDEIPLVASIREFQEETGIDISDFKSEKFLGLGEIKQKSGKVVTAFAVQFDFDASTIKSNLFSMEWPPHSGNMQSFPEADRGEWFSLAEASRKINLRQILLLERLEKLLSDSMGIQ